MITLLGFSSGLPLALSDSTLQAWLTVEDVEVATIGVFSLVGLPYVFKFLWAPALDRFRLGWPGRRRDWTLACQVTLAALLAAAGWLNLAAGPLLWLGVVAVAIAFASATQDVAIDAYRTEILEERERGFGAAVFVLGYRVAMLASGAGALALADRVGFANTYLVMAALLAVGIAANLAGPPTPADIARPRSLQAAVVDPLVEFFRRPEALALLLLIVLYKLGDAFAGRLVTTFLIREVGFSLTDVGVVNKALGLAAAMAGALYGGVLMVRLGLYRALVLFAVMQAVTNLGFLVLALIEKSYAALIAVVALENLTGGMGTAAFVALLMAICDRRFTATQFALLSAAASLGRVFAGPPSGFLVEAAGWAVFFFLTFVIALPAIGILVRHRRLLERLDDNEAAART